MHSTSEGATLRRIVLVLVVSLLSAPVLTAIGTELNSVASLWTAMPPERPGRSPALSPVDIPPGSVYTWTNPCRCPSGRWDHTMVYNSLSDRFILFGGWGGARSNETWSYDLDNNRWTRMRGFNGPSARQSHLSAYDSRSDRVLLYGGELGGAASRETWAYSFQADTWTNMSPPLSPPLGLSGAMAYDSESDRAILFGAPFQGASETWAYDLEANVWTNLTAGQTQRPSPRWGHAIAYDSRADRIILFGGSGGLPGVEKTWAYDFNSNIWVDRNPATKPAWRYRHAMDYDVGADRIVLFGGFAATGVNGETWSYEFVSNEWSMPQLSSPPTGRHSHAMAFHIPSNRTILYGGSGNAAGLGHEIWAYESEPRLWTRVDPDRPAGGWPVMAYDGRSDRVILFGGITPLGYSQTWAHNLASNAWTFMDPSTKPVGIFTEGPAMAFDSAANLTILFSQGGTWAYDFELNAWTILRPSGSPSSRFSAAMAYDSESVKTILFGGDTRTIPFPWVNDTWAFDFTANTWTNMSPGGVTPPPGSGYLMAYDSQSDRTILFGGSTGISGHNETWAYDFNTNTWTNMVPAVSPAVGVASTMAYDSRMHRVIAQGRGETWLYDVGSNAWTNVSSGGAPSNLGGSAMAFDFRSGRAVLFAYDDTWWGRLLAPPTSPTDLRPAIRDGHVTLGWKPPIDDGGSPVSAYRIYRATSPGTVSLYAEVGNILTYDDLGATTDVRYYYQVSAVNGEGEGPRSVEVTNLPPTPPPSAAWDVAHTLVLLNNTLLPGNSRRANAGPPEGVAYDSGTGEIFVTSPDTDTVSVISDATHAVVATIVLPTGSGPLGLAYNGAKGEIYVSNSRSDSVSVISDATHTVVATIPLVSGSSPRGLAYDSGTGEVFVANFGSASVSVISTATHSVEATIPVQSGPWGVAYDSGKGEIFVTISGWSTVSVISDTTYSVVATIPVDAQPQGVVYDAGKGEIFVANYEANTVSVISDETNTVIATVAVRPRPWGMAYDSGRNAVYVADFFSDNVSVISDSSHTVVANISVGAFPLGLAYDAGKGEIFVANRGANTVSVISDTTNTVVATIPLVASPSVMAYDTGTRELYVTDSFRGVVDVISGVTKTVVATIALPSPSHPRGIAYDAGTGEIFVSNSGSHTVSVISDVTHKVVATIPVINPGGMAYDSGTGEIFVVSGPGTVEVISDATHTVVASIPLPPGSNYWGVAYDPERGQIFVTDQGLDTVIVISDATHAVVATIPLFVGFGPVSLAYDDRTGEIYFANVNSNDVRVISNATNRVVANIPVGTRPIGVAYNNRTGEIFVTNWGSNTVSVVSDMTRRIVDTVQVGGDPIWVAYDPDADFVYVSNPGNGTVSILSSAPSFDVSFVAQGLPLGTLWSVALDGASASSTGSEITFPKKNGTYSFTVEKVPGYVASPLSGEVTVDGAAATRTVVFSPSPTRQTVTFGETGLPAGTPWWINLTNGESFDSTSATIMFTKLAGSYAFTPATADKRYASATGIFVVADAPVTRTVTFSPVTFPVIFTQTGLPPGTSWSVTLDGTTESADRASIEYSQMNGSYSFVVSGPSGYSASPASGNLAVDGGPVSIAIQFSSTSAPIVLYAAGGAAAGIASAAVFVLVWRKRRARPPSGS